MSNKSTKSFKVVNAIGTGVVILAMLTVTAIVLLCALLPIMIMNGMLGTWSI